MDETLVTPPDAFAENHVSEQIKQRNAWLERSLNPGNGLPDVDITLLNGSMVPCSGTLPPDVFDGNAGSLYIKTPGTTDTIGDVVYGKDDKASNKLVLTDVSILDDVQGQGYGRRLYLEALKALPLGYGAVCHSLLSDDADQVWQWLVGAGVAQVRLEAPSGQLGRYETVF